jgi:hypothetical protein
MNLSEKYALKEVYYMPVFIFLLPIEGFMCEVYYGKMTLDDLIHYAEIIIEAESSKPLVTERIIPIDPDTEQYPHYDQQYHHYHVLTVLNDDNKREKKGQEILIDPLHHVTIWQAIKGSSLRIQVNRLL